ncbi:MAG: energy transducer TonB [Acidobacteria bacterium]|nr:energy transducer TonB [Acidobacteriota bacterium]
MARIVTHAMVLLFICCQFALYGQVKLDQNAAEALLLERPIPVYPQLARRARVEEIVKLFITVSESGFVKNYGVISGHPLLTESAIQSVMQSRYKPYISEGKAVSFATTVEIPFLLEFTEKDYERDRMLASQYFEQESKCRDLTNAADWQHADEVCRANLAIADKFGKHRELTKMRAYQLAGFAALGLNRYKEARDYLNRAYKFGKSNLKEDDGDLGALLVTLGQAHAKMGNLNAARDSYAKGAKILQLACDHAPDPAQRASNLLRLKKALEYQISAAETAGAAAEAEALKKRLAAMP